tara:strand:- start:590 stop:1957 length:1368 start_codon:yes stop_codon:yes gene_type:complete
MKKTAHIVKASRAIQSYLLFLAILIIVPAQAYAQLKVDVTQGISDPLPVAIPKFYGETSLEIEIGTKIAGLIAKDLERSGLFRVIDPEAYIEKLPSINVVPRFGDWRQINAQALFQGQVREMNGGVLFLGCRLWDVFGEKEMKMKERAFSAVPILWRQVAHRFADFAYERITGESGYFDSRIVYISEFGSPRNRRKILAMMDQDGANHVDLTDGRALVLTPRFSPNPKEQLITYLSYSDGTPRVYLFDINARKQELIGQFPGMTFAPRFSPNGNEIIMSMAKHGNSDIYVMDLRTRRTKKLTRHPAIDTSPSYAPDGKLIVFNSDRGGSQQLYVMKSDGSKVRRISFGSGRYSTPVWSPRGDLIAFTKFTGGEFSIGVMEENGEGERLLASGFLVEGPTWAPNGRVLMFFKEESKKNKLYSIDLTGRNEREIPIPRGGSDPAWGPLRYVDKNSKN